MNFNQPTLRLEARLILISLALIAAYVWASEQLRAVTADQLDNERRRRLKAEQERDKKADELNGALETITEIKNRDQPEA